MLTIYLSIVTMFMSTITHVNSLPVESSTNKRTEYGINAFDCISSGTNMTVVSLLPTKKCQMDVGSLYTKLSKVQIVQQTPFRSTNVKQCGITIKRSIHHCGMHSHASLVEGSYAYDVRRIGYSDCTRIFETRSYRLSENIILHELTPNMTHRGETVIVGSLEGSSCSGGTYTTTDRAWKNVIVKMEYEIVLSEYQAQVDLSRDIISLRSSLTCKYSSGECTDSLSGSVSWKTLDKSVCLQDEYKVLFTGLVNETVPVGNVSESSASLFSTEKDSAFFTIRAMRTTTICGLDAYETDHDRVYVVRLNGPTPLFSSEIVENKDADLFTYYNSKITAIESHIGNQIDSLYRKIMYDTCLRDMEHMKMQLVMSRLFPHEFASNLIGQDGYTAVVSGEVIYLLACNAVRVTIRMTDRCYQEIPVNVDGQPMFMSPVTRTLQPIGTEMTCSLLTPAKYMIGGTWYTIDGGIRESPEPVVLDKFKTSAWSYRHIPNLMKAGIYSEDNVEKMREAVYDNALQRSSSVYLNRVITGRDADRQLFETRNFLSDDAIDTALKRYWSKVTGWAVGLGQFSSMIIGFWMMWKIIKFVIDTVIHGRLLYDIYGLGWQLCAALWDSLTTYLAHRATNVSQTPDIETPTPRDEPPIENTPQLYPVVPTAPSKAPLLRGPGGCRYEDGNV